MKAIFKDDDGRWTLINCGQELDLGYASGGRYIRVNGHQLCYGARWTGDTLTWPEGHTIPGTAREVNGRAGHTFTVSDHEDLPDHKMLTALAHMLNATPYQSRAEVNEKYWPAMRAEDAMYASELR